MQKRFIVLCIAVFLLVTGKYISSTSLVPYAKSLGATSFSIGLIYSSLFIVRLLFSTPAGIISDKIGSKLTLTIGFLLYPFVSLIYYFSSNVPNLMLARFSQGLATAIFIPIVLAYITEICPKGQEGRYMGIYNTFYSFAHASGHALSGLVFDNFGTKYCFLSFFALSSASLLIVTILYYFKPKKIETNSSIRSCIVNKHSKFNIGKNKILLPLCLANVMLSLLYVLFGASFTQYALSREIQMTYIGSIIAINNIIVGISQLYLGFIVERFNKLKLILYPGIIIPFLIILLTFTKNMYLIVILILIKSILMSSILISSSALSATIGRKLGIGSTMGILSSFNSAGLIFGYLLLGKVTDLFNIKFAFYLTAILLIIVITLFGFSCKKYKDVYL